MRLADVLDQSVRTPSRHNDASPNRAGELASGTKFVRARSALASQWPPAATNDLLDRRSRSSFTWYRSDCSVGPFDGDFPKAHVDRDCADFGGRSRVIANSVDATGSHTGVMANSVERTGSQTGVSRELSGKLSEPFNPGQSRLRRRRELVVRQFALASLVRRVVGQLLESPCPSRSIPTMRSRVDQ